MADDDRMHIDVSWRGLLAVAVVTAGLVAMSFASPAACSLKVNSSDPTTTTTTENDR